MFDLHTHHARCGHAAGTLEDYVQEAIRKGLPVLGISDHSPYFFSREDHPYPQLAMAITEFDAYIEEAVRLKRAYEERIELLIGVESDIFSDQIDLYGRKYVQYPIDYVIGSIHFLSSAAIMESLDFNTAAEEQQQFAVQRYVEAMVLGIESQWVQIVGHLDGFKRGYSGFRNLLSPYIDGILKRMADRGVAMEINTNGMQHACREWYPSNDVIERALFHGVQITFGSDAHHPDRIASDWEQVRETLLAMGCKRMVIYKQRKPHFVDL
ncbi:histidinol phosphate phosphatase HisJ family [Paenibacillus curdlanolyticus YK9]|uniref:Histidinol-phosphatase n=1 Tax=Paenibacillus curdlanolyticus YK9 TaxID=717606 RepID=E0I9M8_9BACL|nr:histidinol-phosphatase [Paenibacillus curdlanolyticus]EFM11112.1 histidinol phosphate phosphatase HisJ family [Paenibacillus curdlanolyticus YK9]